MIGGILSNYKLVEVLGSGGMSIVYLGKDIQNGALAAVKVLKKQYTQDKEHINRFFTREIQATKDLNHKNIVKLINYGHKGDIYYLIYEYVKGRSLDKFLSQNKNISISNIENIFLQILTGLSHAHNKGIIHRDIKPQNILITSQGIIKITDFGIAKALSSVTITQTGMFIGSPGYISPEQAEGKKVDNRSDIYSLGVLLFELLTGVLPFKSDTPWGIVHKHIYDRPPDISRLNKGIPPYLDYIVSRCLAKNPSNRFNSVSDIAMIISNKSFTSQTIIKPKSKKSLNNLRTQDTDNKIVVKNQADSMIRFGFSYAQPIWVLVLLMIFTLGTYQIVWFYRNWRDLNEYNNLGISPGWRTIGLFVPILGLILVYGQFNDIRTYANEGGVYDTYPPGWLFLGWLITNIITSYFLPVFSLFLILISVTCWPLVIVQKTLNSYWGKHQKDLKMRSGLSPLEIIFLILGIIFCFFLLIGIL